ncbi:iron chelate uptake ABC transporter family permease subunit [Phytohabitans suffuscus]|uniref:iron chelate uptake ABC transporter family permease subunit n=1 Tax=Phytohabitans suffuscus TaxID=624315 RepID=UPI0018D727A2|nr:iron chelate uptake ABC transporter family permease subunit [Phytohabitans suffuscus]
MRLAPNRISVRLQRRTLWVSIVLVAAIVVVGFWTLVTGSYRASVSDVLAALTGDGPRALAYTVNHVRLPRLAAAVLVGAALGISGALFQSVTRNPLGSPDIIGFTSGSATGAIVAILVLHGTSAAVAVGALAGGAITAAVILCLAAAHGLHGFRIILAGMGDRNTSPPTLSPATLIIEDYVDLPKPAYRARGGGQK